LYHGLFGCIRSSGSGGYIPKGIPETGYTRNPARLAALKECRAVAWYSVCMAGINEHKRALIAQHWPDILDKIRHGARIDLTAAEYDLTRADLWAYRHAKPDLVAQRYDAIKDSADAFVDQMVRVMDDAGKDAKAARVRLAGLQWIAEKRDPDRYGQRTRADINVKTVDLTAIIRDANARLAAAKQGQIIDVTPSNSGAGDVRAHAQPAIEHAALVAAGIL
jgi:hypothetical protein